MTKPYLTTTNVSEEKLNVLDACETILDDCGKFLDNFEGHVEDAMLHHHPVLKFLGEHTFGLFPFYHKKRLAQWVRMQNSVGEMVGYARHILYKHESGEDISDEEKEKLEEYIESANPYVLTMDLKKPLEDLA